jgi:hypothetical protein
MTMTNGSVMPTNDNGDGVWHMDEIFKLHWLTSSTIYMEQKEHLLSNVDPH